MNLRELSKLANKADAGDTFAEAILRDEYKKLAKDINFTLREYEKNGNFKGNAYDIIVKYARNQRGGRVRRVSKAAAKNASAYDIYGDIAQYKRFMDFKTYKPDKATDLLYDRIANVSAKLGFKTIVDENFLNLLGYLQEKLPSVYASGDEIEIIDGIMSKDISQKEREELIDAYVNDFAIGYVSAKDIYEQETGKSFY